MNDSWVGREVLILTTVAEFDDALITGITPEGIEFRWHGEDNFVPFSVVLQIAAFIEEDTNGTA